MALLSRGGLKRCSRRGKALGKKALKFQEWHLYARATETADRNFLVLIFASVLTTLATPDGKSVANELIAASVQAHASCV